MYSSSMHGSQRPSGGPMMPHLPPRRDRPSALTHCSRSAPRRLRATAACSRGSRLEDRLRPESRRAGASASFVAGRSWRRDARCARSWMVSRPSSYRFITAARICATPFAPVSLTRLRPAGSSPATDFSVLLFSIDPRDGPRDAGAAQHEDSAANTSAGIQDWHYLTGSAVRHRCALTQHRISLFL